MHPETLHTKPFRLVVADPAWSFDDRLGDRGAEANYRVMSVADICRLADTGHGVLSVMGQPVAQDAVLLLWRVAAQQQAALDVARAWGFVVKTEFIWLKKTSRGNRWFGLGHTLRAEHEVCLVCTRGRPKVLNHATRSTFVTDVEGFSAAVGRHSEKPDIFYSLAEELFPGPWLELFARKQRPNWTCVGDEVPA